jgi:hypothetical protein
MRAYAGTAGVDLPEHRSRALASEVSTTVRAQIPSRDRSEQRHRPLAAGVNLDPMGENRAEPAPASSSRRHFRSLPFVFAWLCFTSRSWVCPQRAPCGLRICSQVWQPSGMTSNTLQPVGSLAIGPCAEVSPSRLSASCEDALPPPGRATSLSHGLSSTVSLTRYGAVSSFWLTTPFGADLSGVPTSRLPCKTALQRRS